MTKTKIEWCDVTYNPVTGCEHGCDYCYAKRIADRFSKKSVDGQLVILNKPVTVEKNGKQVVDPFPAGFIPTFHKYRLDEPLSRKKPAKIFVCSMADLFGEWVPDSWIQEVFASCARAPQHQYLFLTKNPSRYAELYHAGLLPFLSNFWYGSTVTKMHNPMWSGYDHNTFVSFEPLLEEFHGVYIGEFNWVIIGAETGNRKGKIIPKRSWIETIASSCERRGVPVFMKDSLEPIMGDGMRREFPKRLS
jgi:protein gp37